MKKRYTKYLFTLIAFLFMFISCGTSNKATERIDIYDVVYEAFTTDKGYTDELSKHITEDVFKWINAYSIYNVDSPEYSKPFNVDFSLTENSQKSDKDVIYVEMTYSIEITDSKGTIVGGSWDIPITFTVNKSDDGWCIVEKNEAA